MIINATDTPLYIVTLFALWTALLAVIVPIWRVALVASGFYRVSDFTPGDAHGSALYWRINRAHVNAVENLVVFAALAVAGIASGVTDPFFGTLCVVVMGARIVQTLIHVSSGANAAIMARFVAFAVQVVCYFAIGFMILQHHAAG